jgi:hypothetical protein
MHDVFYSHLVFSASSRSLNMLRWCCCRAIIDGVRNDESVAQGSRYTNGQQVSKNVRTIQSCAGRNQRYEDECARLELENNGVYGFVLKSLGTLE